MTRRRSLNEVTVMLGVQYNHVRESAGSLSEGERRWSSKLGERLQFSFISFLANVISACNFNFFC